METESPMVARQNAIWAFIQDENNRAAMEPTENILSRMLLNHPSDSSYPGGYAKLMQEAVAKVARGDIARKVETDNEQLPQAIIRAARLILDHYVNSQKER